MWQCDENPQAAYGCMQLQLGPALVVMRMNTMSLSSFIDAYVRPLIGLSDGDGGDGYRAAVHAAQPHSSPPNHLGKGR